MAVDSDGCGQEGSPVVVSVTAAWEKPLSKDLQPLEENSSLSIVFFMLDQDAETFENQKASFALRPAELNMQKAANGT